MRVHTLLAVAVSQSSLRCEPKPTRYLIGQPVVTELGLSYVYDVYYIGLTNQNAHWVRRCRLAEKTV